MTIDEMKMSVSEQFRGVLEIQGGGYRSTLRLIIRWFSPQYGSSLLVAAETPAARRRTPAA